MDAITDASFLRKMKKILEEKRAKFEDGNHQPEFLHTKSDRNEEAGNVQLYENNLFSSDRARKAIGACDNALLSMENGTYGICVDCGNKIELERLEAIPETNRCLGCRKNIKVTTFPTRHGN